MFILVQEFQYSPDKINISESKLDLKLPFETMPELETYIEEELEEHPAVSGNERFSNWEEVLNGEFGRSKLTINTI